MESEKIRKDSIRSTMQFLARPLAVLFLILACLYGYTRSLEHSEAYSFIAYMSALARALTADIYVDSKETAQKLVEKSFREKDPYFRALYTRDDFNQVFTEIVGSNAKKYGFFFSSEDGVIKAVLKHSPNFNKIRVGDVLKSVNGITDPSKFLESLAASSVSKVRVQRGDKVLNLTLETATIKPMYCEIKKDIADVTIYFFRESMIADFKECMSKIASSPFVSSIVFDLKQSPGGAIRTLSTTLAMITPKGKLMFYEKRKTKTINYYAKSDPVLDLRNYRVTVLKSHRTASSAEIFAGSLKYNYPHIRLEGEKTYGKWSTIELMPLLKGGIILSVGKVYLPDGSTYEHKGI